MKKIPYNLGKLQQQEGENWYLDLETKVVTHPEMGDYFVVNCACIVNASEPLVAKAFAGPEAMNDLAILFSLEKIVFCQREIS